MTGLHHAREGPSTYVIIGFMEYIKEMLRNKNITIQTLLKNRCVVSVPVVNPDSYDLNVQNYQSSVYNNNPSIYN